MVNHVRLCRRCVREQWCLTQEPQLVPPHTALKRAEYCDLIHAVTDVWSQEYLNKREACYSE